MKLLKPSLTVTALCLLIGLALAGQADSFKVEDGYTLLFNGKDLSGWQYKKEKLDGKTETADKRFEVKDGVIIAHDVGKMDIKDLFTVQQFEKNFNLRLEFRAAAKADSGVYIRGPQLQVRDYLRRNEQKQLKGFKNDDWNLLDISVKGGVVITKVNGKNVTEKDTLELTVKDGKPAAKLNGQQVDVAKIEVSVNNVATCLCNGEPLSPPTMTIPAKGPVGLQAETGKFEFRRVRIKELP